MHTACKRPIGIRGKVSLRAFSLLYHSYSTHSQWHAGQGFPTDVIAIRHVTLARTALARPSARTPSEDISSSLSFVPKTRRPIPARRDANSLWSPPEPIGRPARDAPPKLPAREPITGHEKRSVAIAACVPGSAQRPRSQWPAESHTKEETSKRAPERWVLFPCAPVRIWVNCAMWRP